jgi:hypothetical protein
MLITKNGINVIMLVPIGILIGLTLRLSGWHPPFKAFDELLAPENSTATVCFLTTLFLVMTALYINGALLYARIERRLFPVI